MRIPVLRGRRARLRFSKPDWESMVAELRKRGGNRIESGAFLLTPRDDSRGRITRVVYFDELDPECLQGGISLRGFAYSKLWDICSEDGLRLIADVHTHPSASVAQSSTDREHPMHAQSGHIGLILPSFARESVRPKDVGFHEYFGDDGWRSHFGRGAVRLLYVGKWA